MKLGVEMSRVFRRSLYVAIPVATVVGATVVVYASLNTFSPGEQLSSSQMNANFSALQAEIAALQTAVGLNDAGMASSVGTVPPGTIMAYGGVVNTNPGGPDGGGNLPPAGWLFCDGQQLNGLNPTYSALYAAIGTSFGGNTTSQSFNLPDLRGEFLRGLDQGVGRDPDVANRTASATGGQGGDNVGSTQPSAFGYHNHGGLTGSTDVNHTHSLPEDQGVAASGNGFSGEMYSANSDIGGGTMTTSSANPDLNHTHTIPTDGTSAETRPLNVAVNYIIKY